MIALITGKFCGSWKSHTHTYPACFQVSYDQGMTWGDVDTLSEPVNRWAWQKWSKKVVLPSAGAFRILARATDEEGRLQPLITPGWNPKVGLPSLFPALSLASCCSIAALASNNLVVE